MAWNITIEKWPSSLGVTLDFEPEHGGCGQRISLDFVSVDQVLELLQDYKEHPSPYCLTAACPVHGPRGCLPIPTEDW